MQEEEKKQSPATIWIVILVVLGAAIVLVALRKTSNRAEGGKEHKHVAAPAGKLSEDMEAIVRKARNWGPAFLDWYGKAAPDFTLKDINGKEHSLSQYNGRDVMLIFWATWCGPCVMEVPHLKELRQTVSEDKLAMLADVLWALLNSAEFTLNH